MPCGCGDLTHNTIYFIMHAILSYGIWCCTQTEPLDLKAPEIIYPNSLLYK